MYIFLQFAVKGVVMSRLFMEPIEKDWFNSMLAARNITIDGRPLYAYRITSSEYKSLLDILATRCKENLDLDELLSERGFSVLFVFFATEWYKREYIGGAWRWEDIFDKFTTKKVKNANARSNAVRSALEFLQNPISSDATGKIYFGAIIANGGLPAKYIQNKQGYLGIVGLITAALKYKLRYVVSADELLDFIEDRADNYNFADSLRNESMYQLIVDVVEKIVELKNHYSLNSKSGVITKLDAANPDWREEFPILLEDGAIRTLLDTLMQDASEIRVAQKRPFVKRFLNGNPDELFFDLDVIFPSKPVEKDYFQRYFGITEEMPQTFYLNTWDSNKTKVAKIEADLFKSDVYKILAYNNKLPVTESVILETFSPINDKNINGFKVRLAESINLSEPLVFILDEYGKYLYVGSGDVGVATSSCYVGLADDFTEIPQDLEPVNTFMVDQNKFGLYKCENKNVVIGNYEIRLNDTTKVKQYVLGGRLLQYRAKPYDAYLGLPQLYYIDEEQNYIKEPNVVYRMHNSDTILPVTECVGLVDVCCSKYGKTICKIPAFILPPETQFEYKNITNNSGDILIKNFTPAKIIPIDNKEYSVDVTENTIQFTSLAEIPPATVGFGVWFADNMGHMDISMPFPAKGFGFYDEHLSCINNSVISVNSLHGKRINIFGLPDGCYLKLNSESQHIDKHLTTIKSFAEYRLIDYEQDMRFLFEDNVEDVTLTLESSFERPARLYISKYDMTAEVRDKSIFVLAKTNVVPAENSVYAIGLLNEDAQPICLRITSDGIIDTSALETGIYVIYSAANADFSIKPFVYRHNLPNVAIDDFYKYIIWGDNKSLCNILLSELDFNYDSKLWQEIDRLSKLFIDKDIPLDAVNLWPCVANNPSLLAMYLLRGTFVKPVLDKNQSLPETIDWATKLIDMQYAGVTKMLHKFRDEMLINTALLPKDTLSDVIEKYKDFFNRTLDDMFVSHIHDNWDSKIWEYMETKFKENFEQLKYKIWDKQYYVIATVFKEVSFTLCTLMYTPQECMRVLHQNDESNSFLRSNISDWANSKTALDWSENLFGEINQMLNGYVSLVTAGYDGIKIPHNVSATLTNKCECKNTCKAPLFRFDQYPEIRSYVIHFPMFCAWLAYQGRDAYLNDPELVRTVRNFIRFHASYFVEAYRIATIILSKV